MVLEVHGITAGQDAGRQILGPLGVEFLPGLFVGLLAAGVFLLGVDDGLAALLDGFLERQAALQIVEIFVAGGPAQFLAEAAVGIPPMLGAGDGDEAFVDVAVRVICGDVEAAAEARMVFGGEAAAGVVDGLGRGVAGDQVLLMFGERHLAAPVPAGMECCSS